MKPLLFLLNVLLTVLAGYLTVYLLRTGILSVPITPPTPLNAITEKVPPAETANKQKPILPQTVKAIWKQNLFHPDRAMIAHAGKSTPPPVEHPEEHFELVGIARIGDRACASIIVIPPQSVRRRRTTSRTVYRPRTRTTIRGRNTHLRPRTKSGLQARVYRLNAKVGETGYILAEIKIDSVILRREVDSTEITLTMNKDDEASNSRREQALKQVKKDEKKKQTVTAARRVSKKNRKKRNSKLIPPPPPPPPIITPPGGNGAAAKISRQKRLERLKQWREKQRQYIRNMKNRNTSGNR